MKFHFENMPETFDEIEIQVIALGTISSRARNEIASAGSGIMHENNIT
jgi:hypothetical protein